MKGNFDTATDLSKHLLGMEFPSGRFVYKASQELEKIKLALDLSTEGHCHHLPVLHGSKNRLV